ncbi:hypothetical protein E2320_015991 [Naja naja]|nr:hypothetical protein E2320_015991 [Naja naja]
MLRGQIFQYVLFIAIYYREQYTCNGKLALRSHSTSPPHLSEDETYSSNTRLENPRYLREKPMSLSLMSPKLGLGKNSTSRDEQALFRIHEKEVTHFAFIIVF